MNMVEKAERKGRARAVLFYMMGGILTVNVLLPLLPLERDGDPASKAIVLGSWLAMIALTLCNLLPIARLTRHPLAAFMDDEATGAHRIKALAAGFWAAILSGAVLAIVASYRTVGAVDAAKLIITAAMVVALSSFATQELRATR